MRITVIGTGHLGAVHAACMAHAGHEVLGVDSDPATVAALASGQAPFYEPGLDDLVAEGIGSGRLRFSASLAEAARFGQVHFICVGTPSLPGSLAADVSSVEAVLGALAPRLAGPCLVVGKSTVPVGTAARLAARLAALAPAGSAAELAWNPEFLREGFAVQDTLRPDRIVAGVRSARAEAVLRSVYAPMLAAGTPYVVTDFATAELVKTSANAFLAMKISFINAMADVCDAADGDVVALARALGHDRRIGHAGMTAGPGYGGGCLPKDLRALLARGTELGVASSLGFLREIDAVNTARPARIAALARDLAGRSFRDLNVGLLGTAFKPGTDDVRDSPALAVAAALLAAGARIRAHDPWASDNARAVLPQIDYAPDAEKACEDADIVVHLTEWPEYRELDPRVLRAVVRGPVLLDARNALPAGRWRDAGWTVYGVGVPGTGARYGERAA
jgi:UDPglucose 6-dehydrogenase